MPEINAIGLRSAGAATLAEKLNQLLANYQIFYINARGFHWNIKGEKFFELHLKFEELYTNLQLKNDEIAERILTLGHTPLHTYSSYLKHADIQERPGVSDGRIAVQAILDAYQTILVLQRDILDLAAEAGDEGTNALMSDYIREQEKEVWMYTAWLSE